MPVMTLMSVDLPAPFSPTRAWTSPPRSSNDTSSSARVAPNRLDIPRMARTGAASASVTGRRPARYTPRHPPNGPTCTPRGGQRSKLLVTTVTHIGAPGATRSLAVAGQGKAAVPGDLRVVTRGRPSCPIVDHRSCWPPWGVLIALAVVVRLVVVRIATQLPDDTDLIAQYSGSASLLDSEAMQSGDLSKAVRSDVPMTVDRRVQVLSTYGATAIVRDALAIEGWSDPCQLPRLRARPQQTRGRERTRRPSRSCRSTTAARTSAKAARSTCTTSPPPGRSRTPDCWRCSRQRWRSRCCPVSPRS